MFQKGSKDIILSQIYDMQQRGKRMLSIVDLISSGTVSIELAAHLVNLILKGITISSGSLIGGTGKTTLLASLLSFLPANRNIITTTNSNLDNLIEKSKRQSKAVYLCHEISPASYYSYLWRDDLKSYFKLKINNNNLAFTIHADSPDEVYPQIVNEYSGLKKEDFFKIDVLVFIKYFNSHIKADRKVTILYEKDEKKYQHILTYQYEENNFIKVRNSPLLDKKDLSIELEIQSFLKSLIKSDIYKIENVRSKFLMLLSQIA